MEKQVVTFTERELDIMRAAWQCMESQPKIDMKKLATLCKYTNVGSASNAWAAIKKKLGTVSADHDTTTVDGTTKDKTPASLKRKDKAAKNEDQDTPTKKRKPSEKVTPVKKSNAKKATKVKKEAEEGDDDVGEEDAGFTKTKTEQIMEDEYGEFVEF